MKAVLESTMVRVTLPEMGESVTQGSIIEWRRKIGEYVSEGDPLVEVTTDKVDVEVPATVSGQVARILAHEGDTVAVGAVLAEIDTSKSDGAAKAPRGNNGQRRDRGARANPHRRRRLRRRRTPARSPTIRRNGPRSGSTWISRSSAAPDPTV